MKTTLPKSSLLPEKDEGGDAAEEEEAVDGDEDATDPKANMPKTRSRQRPE